MHSQIKSKIVTQPAMHRIIRVRDRGINLVEVRYLVPSFGISDSNKTSSK
jgi:hypothetical protein